MNWPCTRCRVAMRMIEELDFPWTDRASRPEEERPMHTAHRVNPMRSGLSMVALFAGLLFGATPALAGVGLSVVPDYQATVKVGLTNLPGTLTISNANNAENAANSDEVTNIQITLSCGSTATGAHCLAPNQDPGVFAINNPATGRAGTACA